MLKMLIATTIALGGLARIATADDAATIKIYKAQCATCHDLDGKGHTTAGKKLEVKDWSDGKTLNKMTDAEVDKWIHVGKNGNNGKELMPSFAKLGDDKIKALTIYIRSFQKK